MSIVFPVTQAPWTGGVVGSPTIGVGGGDSSPAYETTAKHFARNNNSGAYYESNQGLWTGTYTQATLIMCIRPLFAGGVGIGYSLMRESGNANLRMGFEADDDGWDVSAKAGGLTRLMRSETNNLVPLNQWSGFAWCFNGSVGKIVVNGTAASLTVNQIPGKTLRDLTEFGNFYFGRDNSHTLRSYVCHIWARPVYHDMADPANWQKFFDGPNSAVPIDLGPDGSLPFGVQPTTFAPDGDLTNNRGSLNNWTQTGGTVATAPISPTD